MKTQRFRGIKTEGDRRWKKGAQDSVRRVLVIRRELERIMDTKSPDTIKVGMKLLSEMNSIASLIPYKGHADLMYALAIGKL